MTRRILALLLAGMVLLASGCGGDPAEESSAPVSGGDVGNVTGDDSTTGSDAVDGTTDTTGTDASGTTGGDTTTGGNKTTTGNGGGNKTTTGNGGKKTTTGNGGGNKTTTEAPPTRPTVQGGPNTDTEEVTYMGNVILCGAKGDGKTDDTQAIQTLLDNWPKGYALYFPAGTYLISEPLKVREGIHLIGEPAKNGVGGAVIKATKSMDYLIGCHDDSVRFNGSIIMSLTLDGGKKEGKKLDSLLDMPGFCSMKLANLKLQNCTGNGVWTYQGKANNPTWISSIENIEVTNVDGWAMYMINSDSAYNHITVNGSKGIMDYNYGGNVYNDIYVANSTGSGLTIGREDKNENGHISIMNSTFKNNKGFGLQLNRLSPDQKRVQVEGCDFINNGLGDVGVKNTARGIFYNCNFRSPLAFGDASTAKEMVVLTCNMAAKKISGTGFLVSADTKVGVTSFTDKGCALDVNRYDYARVYKAAALQCDSGKVVSVEAFGASASAYDDNSKAFQDAINALGSKGGIVFVPKGEYGIAKTVTIPSNVAIVGEGNNSSVAYNPLNGVKTMFEIKKGATKVLFMNGNVVNKGGDAVEHFIKGDSLTNCQFDTVEGNSNVVNGYKNVIYLSNSSNCVVNAMTCGIGDGGNMIYLKNCTNCTVQTGYISRGSVGTYVDGGSGHLMFNNHYDWFYTSAVYFTNGANNCTFANNYCDINQRVVMLDYAAPTNANITISTFISRESGIPARSKFVDGGADRREISEVYIKNAKNVKILACSSDIWGFSTATNKNMIEFAGTNSGILVRGCILGGICNDKALAGSDFKENVNQLYYS